MTSPVYVALDLEATGGSPEEDEITEVAAIRFSEHAVLERFHTLVRPGRPPSLRIQRLTGIDAADLASAPSFVEVRARLAAFLGDWPLVAHSVEIDRDRLQRQGMPVGNPGFDTYEMAGILLPGLPSYGLAAVAAELGVESDGQHRALADADTTRQTYLKLFDRMANLDLRVLHQINELLADSNWPLRLLFREAERLGSLTALNRPIAGRGADEPLPMLRFAGEPALEPNMRQRPLDLAALAKVWSPDGPLAQHFPNYERRPQQEQMSVAVAGAFNENARLLVEAGTGTGKTLAYLVPAAQWATQNNERVVISTNTVNLQDQIQSKDVPDLQRALGQEFRVHVLKGRGNYLCLLRWAEFRGRFPGGAKLSPLESRVLVKVLLWLGQTTTGDVADLSLTGDEQALWAQINATQDTCINDACLFKQRRTCFLFNARRAAESAHLVIVNHALLLSDLATDSQVLPDYELLVLDEAHHLEDQATQHLGYDLHRRDLFGLFGEVYQGADPQRPTGLTQDLQHALPRDEPAAARTLERIRDAEQAVDRCRDLAGRFFAAVQRFLEAEGAPEGGRTTARPRTAPSFEQHTRITNGLRNRKAWSTIEVAWDDFNVVLAELQQHLEHAALALTSLPSDLRSDLERQDLLLASVNHRLLQARVELEALVNSPDDERVYWISQGDHPDQVSLHSAPINVGVLLEELLFTPRRVVVLTSATLTVNGRFDYIRGRLGLSGNEQALQIGSPFNFSRQALIYLPDDLAEPNHPAYQDQAHQALIDFAVAARGRCLVLFTSHAALRAGYRAIKAPLEQQGIVVVAQGVDGSRNQLLQMLRSHTATVVLGSASFWEGVDVAGEALSALAIVKLPFTVPSDPVFAARSDQFERPFDEYAVPQAVLRFKQGFGRLIRTGNDRGVLLVLDRRVTGKYYGAQFLRSLPSCASHRGKLRDIGPIVERWLKGSTLRG